MLLFQELRCVTTVIRDFHVNGSVSSPSLQTYVMSRGVTEQIVTQSHRLGRVQCFKMAKIDPVSPFYLTL